uniref:Uncharacterized protein n=1 Tax=Arundo donax TaxID=35708 RepID=A0A0A9C8Y7_ARUDO
MTNSSNVSYWSKSPTSAENIDTTGSLTLPQRKINWIESGIK